MYIEYILACLATMYTTKSLVNLATMYTKYS